MNFEVSVADLSSKFINLCDSEMPEPKSMSCSTTKSDDAKNGAYFPIESLSSDPLGPMDLIFSNFSDIPMKLKLESVNRKFRELALKFAWQDVRSIRICLDSVIDEALDPNETPSVSDAETTTTSEIVVFNNVHRINEGCILNGVLCRSEDRMMKGLKSILIKCSHSKLKEVLLEGEGYADDREKIAVAHRIFNCLKESGLKLESLHVIKLFARSAHGLPDFLTYFGGSLKSFRAEWMFFENPADRERFYRAIEMCTALEHLHLDWDLGACIEPATRDLLVCAFRGKGLKSLSLQLFSDMESEALAGALSSLAAPLGELFLHQCRSIELPALFLAEKCQRVLGGLRKLTLNTIVGDEVFAYEIYRLLPHFPEICPNLAQLKFDLGFLDFDEAGHYEKEMYGLAMLVRNFLDQNWKNTQQKSSTIGSGNGNDFEDEDKCLVLDWTCDACKIDPKWWIDVVKKEVYFEEFSLILSEEEWNGYGDFMSEKLGMKISRGKATVIFITNWSSW